MKGSLKITPGGKSQFHLCRDNLNGDSQVNVCPFGKLYYLYVYECVRIRPTVLRVREAAAQNKLLVLKKCQSGNDLHINQTKTNLAFFNLALSEMHNQSTLQKALSKWFRTCFLS